MARMGYLRYCDACRNRQTELGFLPKDAVCANCKGKMAAYGRMWIGELKDQKLVDSLYKSIAKDEDKKEAVKLLDCIKSELETPFYYHIPTITKKYKLGSVSPYAVAERLSKMGFKTSMTHMRDSSVRTDAGVKEVIAAVRNKPAR
jgi:tRNA (guanine26-N2/guanine27-N2)-dimethyltransferase